MKASCRATVRRRRSAGQGEASVSPTVIVTTYVCGDIDPAAIELALARLLAAHPWEVAVIELVDIALLTRGENAR